MSSCMCNVDVTCTFDVDTTSCKCDVEMTCMCDFDTTLTRPSISMSLNFYMGYVDVTFYKY